MKRIAITQRVDIIESYNERRDALDQRWMDLFKACHFTPVLVPNHLEMAKIMVQNEQIQGIIFSGGNTLSKLGGKAPERDAVEVMCLEWAIDVGIPVLGVCRGMQVIQDYFGVTLKSVSGHVKTYTPLSITNSSFREILSRLNSVNSYHDFGAFEGESVESLHTLAYSKDGLIKAIKHRHYPIFGQMWHSERENPFQVEELNWIKSIFSP